MPCAGTFGEVYRGKLLRTGEAVAIKILQVGPIQPQKQAICLLARRNGSNFTC